MSDTATWQALWHGHKTPTAEKVVAALDEDEFTLFLRDLPYDVPFERYSSEDCPLAYYLQEVTGAAIRVNSGIASWHEEDDNGEFTIYNQCLLPEKFRRFVREFDRSLEGNKQRAAREAWARVTATQAE
jgi:hypothetical protein